MAFELEKEMAAPVARWLAAQGLLVKQEFKTQWGICDLAACQLDPDKVAIRIRQRQKKPIGSAIRVFVYQHLPDSERSSRGISVERLRSLFKFSESERLESELDRLVASGHAKRTRSGTFQKINGWFPLHKRLVAVELKLSRVSEAIAQARANRNFAPESYIAMPVDVAHRVANGHGREALRTAGIGMIGVEKDHCVVMVQPENLIALSPEFETHAVEQFWKVSVLSSST